MSQTGSKLDLIVKVIIEGQKQIQELITEVEKGAKLYIDCNVAKVKAETDMLQKNINKISIDTDTINKNINNMETPFRRFQTGLATVSYGINLASQALNIANKFKSSITETINLAREDVRTINLIEGTIRATGSAAGFTAEELKKMASELQKTTNFGDDDILAKVSNTLLTFRNLQGDVFKQAQKAVLDMSASLGQDLQSAAMQVGKALQSPIDGMNMLSRVGIRLSDEQQEQIKKFTELNQIAEAQAVILKELEMQFGGLAENTVDPITQLQNAVNDLKESIGLALLPMINNFANSVRRTVESMTSTKSEFEKVSQATRDQQIEFRALVNLYDDLRFKQGESVESNENLKNIVQDLNKNFGEYLGNIDLATISHDNFKKTVAMATEELTKFAVHQRLLARHGDLINNVADAEIRRFENIKRYEMEQSERRLRAKELEEEIANSSNTFWSDKKKRLENQLKILNIQIASYDTERRKQVVLLQWEQTYWDTFAHKGFMRPNDKLEDALSELEQFRDTYREILDEILNLGSENTTTPANTSTESPISSEIDQLEKDLESLKNRLKDRKKIIEDSYKRDSETLDKTKDINADHLKDLGDLNKKYTDDLNALKKQEFEADINLAERKLSLGLMTYDGLKSIVDEYYAWSRDAFSQSDRQYIDALNMKTNAYRRHTEQIRQQQNDLIQKLNDSWNRSTRMYDLKIIDFDELEILNQNYTQSLREERQKIDHEINAIILKIAELEEAGADELEIKVNLDDLDALKVAFDNIGITIAEVSTEFQNFTKTGFSKSLDDMIGSMENWSNEMKIIVSDMAQALANSLGNALGNAFANMILEGKKFSDAMKGFFKDIARFAISYIAQIIAKMAILKAVMMIAGPAGPGGLLGKALGFADGGYTGDGGKHEPAGIVHKGEYVINKEKTLIFKPLLDMINYASLPNIRKALDNISLPSLPSLPPIPKMAYATGGYVTGGYETGDGSPRASNDRDNLLASKLDKMIERLEKIEQKDYNVQVKTDFKGVDFIKQIDKAREEYNRRMQ